MRRGISVARSAGRWALGARAWQTSVRPYAAKSAAANPFAGFKGTEEDIKAAIAAADVDATGPGGNMAKTLFVAAQLAQDLSKSSVNVQEAVYDDLQKVDEAIAQGWKEFFTSPVIEVSEREEVLEKFLDGIDAHAVTRRYFMQLAEDKELEDVPMLIKSYSAILRKKANKVEAVLRVAEPLNERQKQTVEKLLREEFMAGNDSAKLELSTEVEPDLLGGLTLTVDSTFVDMGLASRLEEIEQGMMAAIKAEHDEQIQRLNSV